MKQNLAINFSVIDEQTLREELQKAQVYINALNAQIENTSGQVANISQIDKANYTIVTAVEKGNTVVKEGIDELVFDQTVGILDYSITMPPNPVDGQKMTFYSTYGMAAIKLIPNKDQSFSTDPFFIVIPPETSLTFMWVANKTKKWFRIE